MVSQFEAVTATLIALREADRLKPEHAALIGLVGGLAEAVDKRPLASTLWREYRGAIEQLAQATAVVEQEGDGQAAFLELVRTPVGDPPDPGSPDPRPASGGRRRAVRYAGNAVAEVSR